VSVKPLPFAVSLSNRFALLLPPFDKLGPNG
jgi:hypothetical protein